MKLKLIKDDEVVEDKLEYERLKGSFNINILKEIVDSIRNKTASYAVYDYGDMCEVVVIGGKRSVAIKRFDTDDQEYNRACAEELVELLNQEQ